MPRYRPWPLASAVAITAVVAASPGLAETSKSDGWPSFGGPNRNGVYVGDVFADEGFGLELAWKRPLGSGYSSISVVDGRGVTLFTDGETDFLTAFDAATGEEIWCYPLAPMYAGHSGSHDGPNGTATIHDGLVYALGPRGQLVAVRLQDGVEVWKHTLSETDSRAPHYGFSTTPLVAGDALIILTGGDAGHAITAFDRHSGRRLWSSGDDNVDHQSPILATIGGREHLVAVTNHRLLGVDPRTGEELWHHDHGVKETFQTVHPVDLGAGRLLLVFGEEGMLLEVTLQGDGYSVAQLWRNTSFKHSVTLPALHEGYLYGFSGNYLTCVEPTSGEVVWRSRPPKGLNLILVDGHVVVLNPQGEVVVARATPEGYQERARLPLFDGNTYTPASYADGHIFLRNRSEMAALRVATESVASAARNFSPEPPRGRIAELAAKVAAATDDEKKQLVDAFMAAQDSFPIHEGGSLVHLVYRGEATEVAVISNLFQVGEEVSLQRLAGTDFFWRSFELDPKGHWDYRFSIDFSEKWITDPLNPHRFDFGRQQHSELRMPEWRTPTHLAEPEGPRGGVDTFQFRSEILNNTREIKVYMPPGYGQGTQRYPLLLVHNGDRVFASMLMTNTLDNLIHQGRIRPLVVAFVPRIGLEYGGPETDDYVRLVTEELLPHLDRHYRTLTEPATRGTMGVGSGGMFAVYSTFKAPGTFGRVAAQSFYMREATTQGILGLVAAAEPAGERFYVEWSLNDYDSPGARARADSRSLTEALEKRGFTVSGHEIVGAAGFGSWRGQTDLILEDLYPPVGQEQESGDR